jgi:hypothetical protein
VDERLTRAFSPNEVQAAKDTPREASPMVYGGRSPVTSDLPEPAWLRYVGLEAPGESYGGVAIQCANRVRYLGTFVTAVGAGSPDPPVAGIGSHLRSSAKRSLRGSRHCCGLVRTRTRRCTCTSDIACTYDTWGVRDLTGMGAAVADQACADTPIPVHPKVCNP